MHFAGSAGHSPTIHGLGAYGPYNSFAYSPYTDCPVISTDLIGQNFDCGHAAKARVR
jgi:hypothetical protein